jgi:hypothetical protein
MVRMHERPDQTAVADGLVVHEASGDVSPKSARRLIASLMEHQEQARRRLDDGAGWRPTGREHRRRVGRAADERWWPMPYSSSWFRAYAVYWLPRYISTKIRTATMAAARWLTEACRDLVSAPSTHDHAAGACWRFGRTRLGKPPGQLVTSSAHQLRGPNLAHRPSCLSVAGLPLSE